MVTYLSLSFTDDETKKKTTAELKCTGTLEGQPLAFEKEADGAVGQWRAKVKPGDGADTAVSFTAELDGCVTAWDAPADASDLEEAWARTFTEKFLSVPYAKPGGTYFDTDGLYFSTFADDQDPRYTLCGECQDLVAYAAVARGFLVTWVND